MATSDETAKLVRAAKEVVAASKERVAAEDLAGKGLADQRMTVAVEHLRVVLEEHKEG